MSRLPSLRSAHFLIALLIASFLTLSTSKLLSSRTATLVNGWTRLDPLPPDTPHSITLALHQRNLDQLSATLEAVSDPTNPRYGHYLTPAQLQDMTAPLPSVTDPILQWLRETGGISPSSIDYTPAAGSIRVTAPASALNRLFSTQLYQWRHDDGREAVSSWGDSSIPDQFGEALELVMGLNDFPPLLRHGPVRPRIHPPHPTITQVSLTPPPDW